jgi:type I restriction enzyme S subunit
MSEWVTRPLSALADIRVSNVDKKSLPGEKPVLLCNYMDAYANEYIRSDITFMQATALSAEIVKFKVDAGDVVITKDSETPDDIGIPAVVTDQIDDLVCGYHLALLKTHQEFIDPVFLCKQLGSHEAARYFGQRATGSTRYGLSKCALANFPVSLPVLSQQKKIAAVLTGIDTAIEKTEALIAKYQQIKAGLMHDLFTRGVLPNGQLRPPREEAPELYQETAIGWIPKKWEVTGLANKGRPGTHWIRTGPFGSALKGEHWRTDGHAVITIGALAEGIFTDDELLFVDARDAARLVDFQLKAGDVVFSRVADVGRSGVVRAEQTGWIMSSNLMRIAVDENRARPDFLQMALASDSRIKAQIRIRVNSGGRDVANSDVLNKLRFVWPDIEEQDRIIARANGASRRIINEQMKLSNLLAQKQGLMADLLTGKVSVNAEEPGVVDG